MSISNTPFSTDSYQNPAVNVEKTTKEQLKDLAKIADSGKWYKVEEGQIREADRVNVVVRFFKFFSTDTQQNYAQLADKFKNLVARAIHDISNEKDEAVKKEMNANLDKIIKKLEKINVFNQIKKNVKVQISDNSPPATPQINPRDSIALSSIHKPMAASFENINPNQSIEDAKILYKNHQLNRQTRDLHQRCVEMKNKKQELIDERKNLERAERKGENVEDKIEISENHFRQFQRDHQSLMNDLNELNQKELTFRPNTAILQNEQGVRLQTYQDMVQILNRISE